MRSKKYMNT